MTYHLHTQDLPNVPSLVSSIFPSFTLSTGTGYYHGTAEPACIIEVVTDDDPSIARLASLIQTVNRQQTILIERMQSACYGSLRTQTSVRSL